jgi:dephospho-CoA kinase
MDKYIFITNGTGGCGKDTFASFLKEMVPTIKFSSIDRVKSLARFCGWDGGKREKDRKFLSDLKLLITDYSDMPFMSIRSTVETFLNHDSTNKVLLIDIREPKEIERAKNAFGAQTILITNNRVSPILSNMADAYVNNYEYDIVIENNGTLDDLRNTTRKFVDKYIKKESNNS